MTSRIQDVVMTEIAGVVWNNIPKQEGNAKYLWSNLVINRTKCSRMKGVAQSNSSNFNGDQTLYDVQNIGIADHPQCIAST